MLRPLIKRQDKVQGKKAASEFFELSVPNIIAGANGIQPTGVREQPLGSSQEFLAKPCLHALPNGSRLNCGALVKNQIPLRALSASSAC